MVHLIFKGMGALLLAVVAVMAIFEFNSSDLAVEVKELSPQVFERLTDARESRMLRVRKYLDEQRRSGEGLSKNKEFIKIYQSLHHLYRGGGYGTEVYLDLERQLERFFVRELPHFYDLLFIDGQGDIFFTARKESDFLANINDPQFNGLALHKRIVRGVNALEFVDFEDYSVSAEPASFYLIPVFDGSTRLGVIALQLPINHVNMLLTDRTGLGRTGEVYLINDRQLMLTQSRFIDDITVMRKHIDTDAVRSVGKPGVTNHLISDYRGKQVYSSHERFEYEGVSWGIVAEIDEDEVLSDFYMRHESALYPLLVAAANAVADGLRSLPGEKVIQVSNFIKVDVKELQKGGGEQALVTRGVASCTAIVAYLPGQFAYLAHATPTDAIYGVDGPMRYLLGDEYTDFVATMLQRMEYYDVTDSEKSGLEFVILANHEKAFRKAVRKLLEHGIGLSQIRILYKPEADSIDVMVTPDEGSVVAGVGRNGVAAGRLNAGGLPTLEKLLKQAIGYH